MGKVYGTDGKTLSGQQMQYGQVSGKNSGPIKGANGATMDDQNMGKSDLKPIAGGPSNDMRAKYGRNMSQVVNYYGDTKGYKKG
jgi:hypothetical protein